ncbi:hypothetical protein [Salinisphaera hydrothermalis]|uniref:hypothetical protein n=1 Tax=Salinisphaera hydrothermalis TaxID=563188 RepID=UPI003342D6C6
MKGCCPECGHIGGLMQFVDEGDARRCLALAFEFPAPLAGALVAYMRLFQPPKRALAWSRALKLMQQLHADIKRGYITRRGRDWVAPQDAWLEALQGAVARRDELTLPLKDHAYLYEIISRGANKGEAQAEQAREDARRKRADRPRQKTVHDEPTPAAPAKSLSQMLADQAAAKRSPTTENHEDTSQ